MPILHDKVELKNVTIDSATGFLRANVVFSRVGIQKYTAGELGLQGRDPSAMINVYRPPEEVFHQDSLDSLKHIPMTDDHPPENVTAFNARKYAIGWTGENVVQDGDLVRGSCVLTDHTAIEKFHRGKRELSVGYGVELEFKDGTAPDGVAYQAIQRKIRGNHTALVDAGRCEGACRILDGKCQDCGTSNDASCNCHGGNPMSEANAPKLVSRTVDGLTIQVTDQGAQVIDKLELALKDAIAGKTTAETALATAQTDHTKAIEAKDGEITGLKAQIPDAAALDALAATRANVIADVRAVYGADYDPTSKTSSQMMRDAVAKHMGDDSVKDKSDDFVNGLFTSLRKSANPNGGLERIVSDGIQQQQPNGAGGQKTNDGKPLRGRDAYLQRLKDSSRPQPAQKVN